VNRGKVIKQILAKFRENLDEISDEMLLGRIELEKARKIATAALVELYRKCVEDMDDDELLGDRLKEMRSTAIVEAMAHCRDELEAMTNEQLDEQLDELCQ